MRAGQGLAVIVGIVMGLVAAGCPLTIDVRCESFSDCLPEETCEGGVCRTGSRPAPDSGSTTQKPPDAGGQVGADSGTVQDAGVIADAGCAAVVPLDQPCQATCECETAGAFCQGTCVLSCTTDFECPTGRRCDQGVCRVGPRLGEACEDSWDCLTGQCDLTRKRCEQYCSHDGSCPSGYRCAPDGYCVEKCDDVPATLGLTCEISVDCPRCGFCVQAADSVLRCHQRCSLDRDCGDGGLGACEDRFSYRVCRL